MSEEKKINIMNKEEELSIVGQIRKMVSDRWEKATKENNIASAYYYHILQEIDKILVNHISYKIDEALKDYEVNE